GRGSQRMAETRDEEREEAIPADGRLGFYFTGGRSETTGTAVAPWRMERRTSHQPLDLTGQGAGAGCRCRPQLVVEASLQLAVLAECRSGLPRRRVEAHQLAVRLLAQRIGPYSLTSVGQRARQVAGFQHEGDQLTKRLEVALG